MKCPEVDPLIQISRRLRLQKVASRVRRVAARASAFIQAIISTSLVASSTSTAGISPAASNFTWLTSIMAYLSSADMLFIPRIIRQAQRRTGTPAPASVSFKSAMRTSPKWKMEAASPALTSGTSRHRSTKS